MTDSVNTDETAQADALAQVLYEADAARGGMPEWDDAWRDLARAVIAAGWCPVPPVDDEQYARGWNAALDAMLAYFTANGDDGEGPGGPALAAEFVLERARSALRHLTATPQEGAQQP